MQNAILALSAAYRGETSIELVPRPFVWRNIWPNQLCLPDYETTSPEKLAAAIPFNEVPLPVRTPLTLLCECMQLDWCLHLQANILQSHKFPMVYHRILLLPACSRSFRMFSSDSTVYAAELAGPWDIQHGR